MKCPRCDFIIDLPASFSGGQEAPVTAAHPQETKSCPECGKPILSSARICRFCKAELSEKKSPAKRAFASKHKPCPQCDCRHAEKVKWTPWGSFYFTAMLHHVRCSRCGYGYNGKTGRSNLIPAIGLLLIPLVAIGGLIAWMATIFRDRGWF